MGESHAAARPGGMSSAVAFAVLLLWGRLAALAVEIVALGWRRRHGPLSHEVDAIRAERHRRALRRARARGGARPLPLRRRSP